MRRAAALLLALAALPAAAGQRSSSFQVGAVVVRSARLRVEARRVEVTAGDPAAVIVGAAPVQLAARDVALPPGAVRVTVLY
jgi:hypothetical protein